MLKRRPTAAGIVIDIRPRYAQAVRTAIINTILQLDNFSFMDDRVYVFHPDLIDIPTTQGLQVASAFYFKPIERMDVEDALRQTTYMIGYDCPNMDKHIILITDYYDISKIYKYKKPLLIDKKEDFECQFHFIGIGEQNFEIFSEFNNITYQTIESTQLQKSLQEIIKPNETNPAI